MAELWRRVLRQLTTTTANSIFHNLTWHQKMEENVALSWVLVFAGCSYCLCNCFQHLIMSPAVAGLCCREFEKNQLNEQIQKTQEQLDTAQNETDSDFIISVLEELRKKAHRHFLSNIGELLKLNMLTESFMHR